MRPIYCIHLFFLRCLFLFLFCIEEKSDVTKKEVILDEVSCNWMNLCDRNPQNVP